MGVTTPEYGLTVPRTVLKDPFCSGGDVTEAALGVTLADMEAHRNYWLALAAVLGAVGAAFLTQGPLSAHGSFYSRPHSYYAVGFLVACCVCLILALRQIPVPFLRGADAARLFQALRKLLADIESKADPDTATIEAVVTDARKAFTRWSPHRCRSFDAAVANARQRSDAPVTQLDWIRHALEEAMKDLEQGGVA